MALALVATALGAASCVASDGATVGSAKAEPSSIAESPAAQARIEEIRARFLLSASPPLTTAGPRPSAASPSLPRPAVGASVASGFDLRDGEVRAVLPAEAKRGAARSASVILPVRANDPVRLDDDTSRVAVGFALRGARAVPITTAGGVALYAGALAGADVVHRVHTEGTEDYVVFEDRPAAEELAYDVDLGRVAGLRLVSNTLEFLDGAGAPRLRVAPPYVVDAAGSRSEAVLAVEGCAFDRSPRAPWGRAVTAPGASRCGVVVRWTAATYPALVDPSWTATGSMATTRYGHTATLLGSGKVLVAGGTDNNVDLASAELYDAATGTFAAAGSMAAARYQFTATLLGSGEVLLAGGYTGSGYTGTADLYDATAGTFTATGSMGTPRSQQTATLLGSGKVLVAGGFYNLMGQLPSAELYDPAAGTFSGTGNMTGGRVYATATLLGSGKVLVAGGGFPLTTADLYDPTAGTFTATGSMMTGRFLHTATLLGSGKVLVAGGTNGGSQATAEVYDATAGTFTATGSMTIAHSQHSATLLASGSVLIAGGLNTVGSESVAELYDATAGSFAATSSMTTPRDSHTATLLASGSVLVAGGEDVGLVAKSAELYEVCAPLSTCPAADDCGTIADGCGGMVTCGAACTAPQSCGGGGTANVCGCKPLTTCPAGDTCGTLPDGCGGMVTCGSCVAPKTCGGAGTPNTCGCTPLTTCPPGDACGTLPDGCGGTVSCGSACTSPQTCGGGGTANVCGCTPVTTCPAGDVCGAVPDGCGATVACGSCAGGQTCTSNQCVSTAVDAGTDADVGDAGGDGGESLPAAHGCSCETAPHREASSPALLGLGAIALLGLRRLRRHRGGASAARAPTTTPHGAQLRGPFPSCSAATRAARLRTRAARRPTRAARPVSELLGPFQSCSARARPARRDS
jgi:hypothetical protein